MRDLRRSVPRPVWPWGYWRRRDGRIEGTGTCRHVTDATYHIQDPPGELHTGPDGRCRCRCEFCSAVHRERRGDGVLICSIVPRLAWADAQHDDEPRDQVADTELVPHGYWSLGPQGAGWSVTLVEQDAGLDVISERTWPGTTEAEVKDIAQWVEDTGKGGL